MQPPAVVKDEHSAAATQPIREVTKPQTAAKPTTGGFGFSLKNVGAAKEEAAEDTPVYEPEIRTPFSQEDLDQLWGEMVKQTPRDPMVYYLAVSSYKPVLKENFVIEQRVDNKMMEEALLEKRADLYAILRHKLNNNVLQITVLVNPSAEKSKVLTANDKFARLAEINPAVNDLRIQLDLEIEN